MAAAALLLLLLLWPTNGVCRRLRRLHTLFSVESGDYFDWQAVGLLHSLRKAGQPSGVTRLLSCSPDQLPSYRGLVIATPSVSLLQPPPRTGIGRYPAINKPAGVVHWLEHSLEADNVDWVVILDADQIVRGLAKPATAEEAWKRMVRLGAAAMATARTSPVALHLYMDQ
ncbi:hypothetical protein ZWY2020_032073 [Hordeum vulgare]|nr:hypothetical protein ZWY2020_032073 [Hordeum vulgare]